MILILKLISRVLLPYLRRQVPRTQGISVPKQLGERAIRTLTSLGLLNHDYRIQSDDELTIPLTREPDSKELAILEDILGVTVPFERDFQTREFRPKSLKEALTGILPESRLSLLPKSMDIIGQVAIVEIPCGLEEAKSTIGKAVLETHSNLRTVLAKTGPVTGQLRLREFEIIAGDTNTETTYKEYECIYLLDPMKVYFSPRLSTERHRIAQQIAPGETVLDMFAGVGPFSILIAKTQPKAKVYAVELNPLAAKYFEKNIHLNHVEGRVTPIPGDARHVIQSRLLPKANRVIMNLPETALAFIETACQGIGENGVIHYYTFKKGSEALREAEEEVIQAVIQKGREAVAVEDSRRVRETAPRTWQVAVDLRIR